jgi:hypothetical protein
MQTAQIWNHPICAVFYIILMNVVRYISLYFLVGDGLFFAFEEGGAGVAAASATESDVTVLVYLINFSVIVTAIVAIVYVVIVAAVFDFILSPVSVNDIA